MNAALRHRGPDSEGVYIADGTGLAVRRLAIIDLVTGNQPMSNEDGSIWIVFNGEIYNYASLRPTLESKGHTFRTHADTEAIVHLYEEYGPDCLQYLRGMFALAVWDARTRRLFLARDRVGKKPLYYAVQNGTLLFGSELKSLLPAMTCRPHLNLAAIHHYLTLQYIPDPLTVFQEIHKLAPGHWLIWQDAQITLGRYWDLTYESESKAEWRFHSEELRRVISEAVCVRLASDVPLGAWLSGGLDSAIVVGLMARQMTEPVKTFSIGFSEEAFSEMEAARRVAEHFGTDHHEFVVTPRAAGVLPALVWHCDEPLADPATLPTWYLAQHTRQHVTVALNGDGGDEAFAGYQRYYADALADLYGLVPRPLREGVLDKVWQMWPASDARPLERNVPAALQRLGQAASLPREASILRWGSYFTEADKRALYTDEMTQAVVGLDSVLFLTNVFDQARARTRLDRTLYTDVHTYLPGALLVKADRMSMAHSLEVRSPLLDHRVMELAATLPQKCKIHGWTTKRFLRQTFSDLIPAETRRRAKQGFAVPLGMWFRGELRDMARDTLLDSTARQRGWFRPEAVQRLLDEHQTGRVDHGKRIWALLILEMWCRRFVS
jgi:asparagine synthase (glutamine-hydrolysing)